MTTAAAGTGTTQTPEEIAAAAAAAAGGKTPEQLAAETKAATDAAAAKKATDDAAALAAKNLPPEKYTLTLAEDRKDLMDEADLKGFEQLARTRKWSQERAAQELEERTADQAAMSAAFRAQTEADPTYGGEKLADTQQHVKRVLDRFAPVGDPLGDELRRDLVKSGYGNKLSVIAALARIGKQMAEDSPIQSAGGGAPSGDLATRLYGKDPAPK